MTGADELAFLPISEAGARLRDREISCRDLTDAVLSRIERFNPVLNCYGLVLAERALAHADALDRLLATGVDLGPLHGIPIAVKDNIDTGGVPTTMGSQILAGRIPPADATSVARLSRAGAVCIGKANLYEWAYGGVSTLWGPARNPWNPEFEPGSSSSGSAVAVAAGLALGALGTDTGGSIRKPAGLCGVLGLMPSHGRVSRAGVFPVSPSLDRVGPIARDARGAYEMFRVIAGFDEGDPATWASPKVNPLGGSQLRKIGVVSPQVDAPYSAPVAAMMQRVESVYRDLGYEVISVDIPSLEAARKLMWVLTGVDAAEIHREQLAAHADRYSPTVRTLLETALFTPAIDYARGQRQRGDMLAELQSVFRQVEVIILPNTPIGPWRFDDTSVPLGESHVNPRAVATTLHPLFNLTGNPAASVLAYVDSPGLPLAFQIAGARDREDVVLAAARAYELAAGTNSLRPRLSEAPPSEGRTALRK